MELKHAPRVRKEDRVTGPTLPFSQELHASKYRSPGESFRDAMNRVAGGLSDDPGHYHEFRDVLLDMRFLPGGRIQSSIGAAKATTAFNCYVSGEIEDSFIDGQGSIMARVTQAAATMRMGGGIGYDFSTLRPRGALVKKLGSQSSGPVAFMGVFDAVCQCVKSSGHRRGAQMGVMRVDHPDIVEFIHAKQDERTLTGFNLSVAVTDDFMECLAANRPFPLRWGGEVYREVDPAELWDTIMRSTWDWAEPGVLFIDTINRMNNLWYCESIAATNPCGEQPLPPFGACLLGSFNLARYMTGTKGEAGSWHLDLDRLVHDVPTVVRAMDNVVEKSVYPLYEQEKEARSKRRMGLGVTGLANALEAEGRAYGSEGFVARQRQVLGALENAAYSASARLAKEKGRFPMYDATRFLAGKHVSTALSEETLALVRQHGLRNSHLTSIAPTGTISSCADNISSSIEPVFAYSFERTVQTFDGPRTETIPDYGVSAMGVYGRRTSDVSVREHLAVLVAAQQHVDSAVSKTCNVPGSVDWAEFKQVYQAAWEAGAKGCTTFRSDGKRGGVLVSKDAPAVPSEVVVEAEPAVAVSSCEWNSTTGRRSCE